MLLSTCKIQEDRSNFFSVSAAAAAIHCLLDVLFVRCTPTVCRRGIHRHTGKFVEMHNSHATATQFSMTECMQQKLFDNSIVVVEFRQWQLSWKTKWSLTRPRYNMCVCVSLIVAWDLNWSILEMASMSNRSFNDTQWLCYNCWRWQNSHSVQQVSMLCLWRQLATGRDRPPTKLIAEICRKAKGKNKFEINVDGINAS